LKVESDEKSQALIDRVQDTLFARTRKADASGRRRADAGRERQSVTLIRKVLVGSVAIVLLATFISIFHFYSKSLERIKEHPLVTDFASPSFPAKLRFGHSPECKSEQGAQIECWVDPAFDDTEWSTVELPRFDIRALPGYRSAVNSEFVYYRLRIPVSESLRQTSDTIAFSPSWINHQRFQIFLSGRQVYEGDGKTNKEALVTIPIPKLDIKDGYIDMAIKATMSNADVGIRHHGGIYIGPKAIVDELHVSTERISVTYFLLILLSKGSVFIIFALFFVFTKGQRGFFDFLIYALFVTLENVFIMSDFVPDFNVRVSLYFLSKTIAIFALQRFFAHHYEVHRIKGKLLLLGVAQILIVAGMVVDHGWGTKSVTIAVLLQVTNYLLVATLVGATLIGLINLRMYKRLQVGPAMPRALWEFVGVTTLYLALLIWEVFFTEYRGTDRRAVFDLIFFYYIALVSARHSGTNEGKIVTLEGHMEEKERMEAELLEAAEIAKAFLPDEVPQWENLAVAVHHQSYSESSGDWYAFERSPSGLLQHAILCDITGHGVQAAIVVSACKTVLSTMLAHNPDILDDADFIEHYARTLNHTLFSHGAGRHTATMIGLTFASDSKTVRYLCAGHPPAMLVLAGGEAGRRPKALNSRNSGVGVNAEFNGKLGTSDFKPGDQVIAYTDGLPLAANVRVFGQFIAEQGNVKDLEVLPRKLYDVIWAAESKKKEIPPDDDVSIVWFRGVA